MKLLPYSSAMYNLKIENIWHSTVCSFIIALRKSPYSCCNWTWLTQLCVLQRRPYFDLWMVIRTALRVVQLFLSFLLFILLETIASPSQEKTSGFLMVEGCHLFLFHSPSQTSILQSFLWRCNSVTSWPPLDDELLNLVLVSEVFYNSALPLSVALLLFSGIQLIFYF